jgi:hypothetical protein
LKKLFNLILYIVKVYVDGNKGIVKISLKDTVTAINRAVGNNIDDPIPAAKLSGGGGTFLDQLAGR